MHVDRMDRMVRGWLVGDFDPSVLRTQDFEFGVKTFKAGDHETWHFHKIATEITVIVSGEARMNGRDLKAGDIVVLKPGEGTDFECLSDVTAAVVKTPGAPDDKFTEREANA